MAQDCIFCQIVRGDAPASVIYDDADVLAFMNRFQSVPGHVLIMPKAHVETLYALSNPLAGALLVAARRIARAVKRSLTPGGITVLQDNEPAGGQEIAHVHLIHVDGEPDAPVTLAARELADDVDLQLELDRDELAALLDRALALLPVETRQAPVQLYIEALPQAEVAARLGMTEGAVAVRLHRGRWPCAGF